MLRVVIDVESTAETAQELKEKLAMDFEQYGDVKIVDVHEFKPEQLRLDLTE